MHYRHVANRQTLSVAMMSGLVVALPGATIALVTRAFWLVLLVYLVGLAVVLGGSMAVGRASEQT